MHPIDVTEVPSGTPVLDWTVPDEWNVRDAYVALPNGRRVIDFRRSNLHLVSYSEPFEGRLSLGELRPRLHSLPDRPAWIPYRTSYYERTWGFCLAHSALAELTAPEYDVRVDTSLEPGALTYGEIVLPGETEDEFLLSAHVCHPSLANDNLSGAVVATFLARELARVPRRLTLRIVLAPGTIGAITWLERNRARVARIRAGLTLVCLGDEAPLTYKRTFSGGATIDRAAVRLLREAAESGQEPGSSTIDFFPYGYDERQYNAPAFRVPVGSLTRGRHGQFPQYHTSADDLTFVSGAQLARSCAFVRDLILLVDRSPRYRSLAREAEPQLGRRGLYGAIGGAVAERDSARELELAMLWVLSMGDGTATLLDVCERSVPAPCTHHRGGRHAAGARTPRADRRAPARDSRTDALSIQT